jgi:hypothetical protein
VLLAAVVLAERPTAIQLAGAVLVCSGALAVSLAATSRRLQPGRGPGPDQIQPVSSPALRT